MAKYILFIKFPIIHTADYAQMINVRMVCFPGLSRPHPLAIPVLRCTASSVSFPSTRVLAKNTRCSFFKTTYILGNAATAEMSYRKTKAVTISHAAVNINFAICAVVNGQQTTNVELCNRSLWPSHPLSPKDAALFFSKAYSEYLSVSQLS